MKNLPFLSESDFDWQGKTVLLRFDSDVPVNSHGGHEKVSEDYRLRMVLPTVHFLQRRQVGRIIFLGHRGRPQGKNVPALSLRPVAAWLKNQLGSCRLINWRQKINGDPYQLWENLRFQEGETANSQRFARRLAQGTDVFINDAFAVSHRYQASIVGLPRFLPAFLGLRFETEVKTLLWQRRQPQRPLVFVLGGSKPGKLDYLPFLTKWTDRVLLGGRLPELMKPTMRNLPNLIVAQLAASSRDINAASINRFRAELNSAATIFWAGPLGIYEEKANRQGTWAVARAIAKANAFKVAGGGDTQRVLSQLKLWRDFNFVSVGGGAMLQFLRDKTLPGMELPA